MKVLITGGAGFIGSHLAEHFSNSAEVVVLDNLSTGEPGNLDDLGNCNMTFGSVLNRLAVRRAMEGVDYVFHLAGNPGIRESFERPLEYAEVESLGTLIVLEEAAQAKVRKMVYASSAAVYGDCFAQWRCARNETDNLEPKSPYAAAKLAGEVYCRMFTVDQKLTTVCARIFNAFGPRQRNNVVDTFIYRALNNRPLVINGNGTKIRDFIYIKAVVAALVFSALTPGLTGAYNIGTGHGLSLMDLAKKIIELTNSRSEIHQDAEHSGDIGFLKAATDRLQGAGFTPPLPDLEEGLRQTIAACRK
jgi:UDP-glucose 4-epimerase